MGILLMISFVWPI